MESNPQAFATTYRLSLRAPTRLMNEIVAISKEYQAHVSRKLGVNASDLAIIEQVMLHGPQSPSELARRLGLSAPAITTAVDRLVAHGHVTRSQHPTDRRAVLVAATPASVERALHEVLPVAKNVDAVLDEFDEAERDAITRYLTRVTEAHNEGFAD